jgi:rubrerythrin
MDEIASEKPGERTGFEKSFSVDLSTGSAGIEKAIEMGINIEQAGQRFYMEKASQANIPQVQHQLKRLADDEVKHTQILQELKKSLLEKGEWIGVKELPDTKARLKELSAFGKENGPKVKDTSSAIEVLNEALKLEERVSNFYKGLASELKNDKGKEFFEKLAEWEQGHYKLIKRLIEIVHGMEGSWG